jgi:hypothetical protein
MTVAASPIGRITTASYIMAPPPGSWDSKYSSARTELANGMQIKTAIIPKMIPDFARFRITSS